MQTQAICYYLLELEVKFMLIFYLMNLLGNSVTQILQSIYSNILCLSDRDKIPS